MSAYRNAASTPRAINPVTSGDWGPDVEAALSDRAGAHGAAGRDEAPRRDAKWGTGPVGPVRVRSHEVNDQALAALVKRVNLVKPLGEELFGRDRLHRREH